MWIGWPISRAILLFISVVFAAIFIQVTMFHYRQNFQHWAQWVPVLALPVLSVVSLAAVFYISPIIVVTAGILYFVGLAAGITGFALHTSGVSERVGGYNLNNFMVGPPVVLPIMVTAISVLGLIALYWR